MEEPTPEQKRQILKARAAALAQEPAGRITPGSMLEIVEFSVAREKYAIESAHVYEVTPLKDLTALPCVPPFVAGLINVRGRILSVIDLKKLFDMPEHGIADLHNVIIVGDAQLESGILADGINGVRAVELSDVQPTLPTLTGIRADYLRGITRDQVVILDVAKILSDPRLVVRQDVAA